MYFKGQVCRDFCWLTECLFLGEIVEFISRYDISIVFTITSIQTSYRNISFIIIFLKHNLAMSMIYDIYR